MPTRVRQTDPHQSVQQALADRRGFVSQKDIVETKRAVARLGSVGEEPNELPGNLTVAADINWGGDAVARWPMDLSYLSKQLVIRGIGAGVEQDYFRFWYSGGAAGFEATNLYNGVDKFFIFRSSTTFNSPYVLLRGPGMFYFRNAADFDTMSIDPETGTITTSGVISAASGNRWESGAHHDPGATTLSVKGMPAWTVGSPTSADDADGSWASYASPAVTGSAVGPNGPLAYRRDWEFDATFHVKTTGVIANLRIHSGLYASDPSATASPTINCCGFRFDTGVPDTNWICRFGDGAAGASLDSGVAVAANTEYYLRIVGDATSVRWYINGALVATRTTNLPTLTALLAPYIRVTPLSNAIRTILFGFFNALSQ